MDDREDLYSSDQENLFLDTDTRQRPLENEFQTTAQKATVTQPKKERCTHWGLTHWFLGMGEYLNLCCCGDNSEVQCLGNIPNPKDAVYEVYSSKHPSYFSDCGPRAYVCKGTFGDNVDECLPCIFACCLPIALFSHLLFLPCACCKVSKQVPDRIFHFVPEYYPPYRPPTNNGYPIPAGNSNSAMNQAEAEAVQRRQQAERSAQAAAEAQRANERARLLQQTENERRYYENLRAQQAAEQNRRRV